MITSPQNSKVKLVRALMGAAKDRRAAGAFVVEGVRMVEEAAGSGATIRFFLHDDTLNERGRRCVEALRARGLEGDEVPGRLMQALSDTGSPQGLLAVLDELHLPLAASPDFILIPDLIRDPGNLGTLLRSAAAAGVQAALLPPETTDAFAPKVLRAGMGAHFRLPIHTLGWPGIVDLVRGLEVWMADMDGVPCWQADLRRPLALIIGGEAGGAGEAARRLAAARLGIPMAAGMESLNAGAAGSVLLFEVRRQRSLH